MRMIQKGSTDITDYVFLVDSVTGAPETALTITDLDIQYVRNGAAPAAKVDATALGSTGAAHSDNGMIEIDATDQPGLYRVDIPDAAFATGASQVIVTVHGTGIHPAHLTFQLVDFDPEDSVRMGLTALPNAAADAAGGLPISDAGGLDLDAMNTNINDIETDTNELQTDWANGGRLDLILDDILADTAELQGDWVNGGRLDLILDDILADTNELQGDWTNGGRLDLIIDDILVDTADMQPKMGTFIDFGSGTSTLAANLQDMADDGTATYDRTTDSLQAIRDRGDAAWTTGGGGSIADILNVIPVVPSSIDLADTATVRLGLMLTNALDDLPSTAEITPGTISIDRKAIGGTSWTAILTDQACSEQAGMVYFDEVFDSSTGYAEGDSIRITFKSQSITVASNDHEITGSAGVIFQTEIRQTMRGTNSAVLATTVGTPAGADLSADIAAIKAETATIVTDTNELQTDLTDGGRLDLILDSILADTNELQGDWTNGGRLDLILDDILADTNELQGDWADGGRLDLIVDAILVDTATLGTPAGADFAADIAAIKAETASIVADTNELQTDWADGGRLDLLLDTAAAADTKAADIQSRLPASLTSGRMNSNIAAIDDNTTAAVVLRLASLTVVQAEAEAGTLSNTQMSTTLTEVTDDHYNGRLVAWTSGALVGQYATISDYDGTTKILTFSTVTDIPADGDTFVIL